MPRQIHLSFLSVLLAIVSVADADVLTVPGEYATINAAIAAAVDGDTIEVSAGTYVELVSVIGKRLDLVAVDGPDATTILSPSAFARCVLVSGAASSDTRLEGFTLRNGFSFDLGGGLRIQSDAQRVVIEGCLLDANSAAGSGGGAAVLATCTAIFRDCTFRGNEAGGDGGGLFIAANGGFTVERCRFEGNFAEGDGGGARVGDTAVLTEGESAPRILNSVFTGNSAGSAGGGAYVVSAANSCPTFNCYAGGVYGSTFTDNLAAEGGAVQGGVPFAGASLSVVNCILRDNVGDYGTVQVGKFDVPFEPFFLNCNLDFEGDPDPRFVSALGADGEAGTGDELLQLLPGSPCIDAGYVYAGDSAVLNGEFDVEGGPRRLDSVLVADTGTTEGPVPIVDIGAHEFDDDAIGGSIAVWTGGGGDLDASGNWFEGVTPGVARATWFDGPMTPETVITVSSSTSIGELYVNTGAWSLAGDAGGSVDLLSVRKNGEAGEEPAALYLGVFAGDEASLSISNLDLSCGPLVLARGDLTFGPDSSGEVVEIEATGGVFIATDTETRRASMLQGEGALVATNALGLPPIWNLGILQPTGLLEISGDYYQSDETGLFADILGRLRFDLADPQQSLAITGQARLGGPVEFIFDPAEPPALDVGDTFEIVSATDGFNGTAFSLARTSGLSGGLFLTIDVQEAVSGSGSTVVATVNSADELLLGDSDGGTTDGVVDAIVVDVDGVDGPDLVLSVPDPGDPSGTVGDVVILLNQGSTGATWDGFEAFGSAIVVPVGRSPAGLDAGDLDGDGDVDIVVANRGDGDISILLNDGTGTSFARTDVDSQPSLATNADPLDVYVGDLDADGFPDIAVSNGLDGSVVAFQNQTTPFVGGFGGMDSGTESDPGGTITVFDPGEAQGKDRDDRVKGSSRKDNTVKTSNSTSGASGGGIVLTWASNAVGSAPADLAVGDLNDDGRTDVATADESGGTISILLGDPILGYLPASTIAIGDAPVSIDVGDLDGDGDVDLGVICEDTSGGRVLRIVQNMLVESGQFTLSVLSTDALSGEEPFLLRVRDVDLDGGDIEDVVALTASSPLTGEPVDGFGTLLGLGTSAPCVGDINGDGEVDAADLGLLIGSWGGRGAADLNGDGVVNAADLGLLIGAWGPCGGGFDRLR